MENTSLTFMGTGTSQGVPMIGCKCEVCVSADERDKRFRASALVRHGGLSILVDAGPDFRMQMLRAGISHLDAILITHHHRDHTGGLDDVRSLNYIDLRAVDVFCERNVLEALEAEYPYAFAAQKYPGAPEWRMNIIGNEDFFVYPCRDEMKLKWVSGQGYCHELADGSIVPTGNEIIREADRVCRDGDGVRIVPIRGLHGSLPVLGFRFGDIAYITDMSSIEEEELVKLRGLKHLTLNTVGYKVHHSHFHLDKALELADRVGAEHTWLTHLSHTFPPHELFCKELERLCRERGVHSEVRPAYDGLTIF